jgi:hypothetical protein
MLYEYHCRSLTSRLYVSHPVTLAKFVYRKAEISNLLAKLCDQNKINDFPFIMLSTMHDSAQSVCALDQRQCCRVLCMCHVGLRSSTFRRKRRIKHINKYTNQVKQICTLIITSKYCHHFEMLLIFMSQVLCDTHPCQ